MNAVSPKDRQILLHALRSGVVPKSGLHHVQVGRTLEIEQVQKDIKQIEEGGTAIRFIIGDYGAGKTFFLNLTKNIAWQKKLVVLTADLAPDRKLHGTGGQARNLYSELIRNMSTRTKTDGGALQTIIEKFLSECQTLAEQNKEDTKKIIASRLESMIELTGSNNLFSILVIYLKAHEDGDIILKSSCLKWLRGEYTNKTEARQELGVRHVIDDANCYDYLKVITKFITLAGYNGALLILDEMVNLHRIVNSQARSNNYEQTLRIFNDVIQGNVQHFGIYFAGTPEFLTDTRRGLYSYEALRSRLAENKFSTNQRIDFSGPVIRLQSMNKEDFLTLLMRLHDIFNTTDKPLLPQEAYLSFIEESSKQIGHNSFNTPRNSIKGFLDLLFILEQNPTLQWQDLIKSVKIEKEGDEEFLNPENTHENKTLNTNPKITRDDALDSIEF